MQVYLRGNEEARMYAQYLLSVGGGKYPHTEVPDVITLPDFI